MVMKEDIDNTKDLTGKLCDFRGHTVLVVKKYKLTFAISDKLEMPVRYDVMFQDGSIDIVSVNSLKLLE